MNAILENALRFLSGDLIDEMNQYLSMGGFIMIPLTAGTFLLWYVLGYRFARLKRGSKQSLRQMIQSAKAGAMFKTYGFIDEAVFACSKIMSDNKVNHSRIEAELNPIRAELKRGATLARAIVLLAPLAGLLGTVTGMIEMFNSLADSTFLSQSGGVAKGIGEALFTTQLGLAIGIPGLLVSRALERREHALEEELDQLSHLLNAARNKGVK